MGKKIIKWDFRDVSSGIQKLRQFLLGRKYIFHNRFPPLISPRSIPPPDIPRGPDYKYSDQWYSNRNVLDSVKPPVVAPIAEGNIAGQRLRKKRVTCSPQRDSSVPGGRPPTEPIEFPCVPTPGLAWWFDGHCYYTKVPDVCRPDPPSASTPCPPPPCDDEPTRPFQTCSPPPPPPPTPKTPELPQKCPEELPPACHQKRDPDPCARPPPPPPPPPICDPCKPPDPKKKC